MTRPMCWILTLVLSAPLVAAGDEPVWRFSPDKGFIDDPMAFDDAGEQFAFVHTDSATYTQLLIVEPRCPRKVRSFPGPPASRVPQALHFASPSTRLLVIWRDGRRGGEGFSLYDTRNGRVIAEGAPSTRVTLARHQGQDVIAVTDDRASAAGATAVRTTLYRVADGSRLTQGQLSVGRDGTVVRPTWQLLYWKPARTQIVAREKGAFDPQQDIRLPDRVVHYDLLQKKLLSAAVPQDLVTWGLAVEMRVYHPDQHAFSHVSDDRATLYYVTGEDQLQTLSLPVPWKMYDPQSLQQWEPVDRSALYLSLTLDPLHPEALARQKADPQRIDLYRVDPGPRATLIGQQQTNQRRMSWAVGRDHLAYLHKLKGFSRGGRDIMLTVRRDRNQIAGERGECVARD